MSKMRQFISVVVYVYNNADRIEEFITTVMKECEVFKQSEIIFVDDCSTDNSVSVIKDYYKKNPADYVVSIICMGRHHGMETAMNAGRDMAIGDYVYEFDDLYVDYEGSVIIDAYNKCLEGNDIVTVSTNVPMQFTSNLFYNVFNKSMRSNSPIGQESFRLLSRRGINRIISMDVEIPYRKVIYHNSGLSTANVEYRSTKGIRPSRGAEKVERFDLAIESFIYFTNLIERISLMIAVMFGLLFIASIVYTIVSRINGYHIGQGYISSMIIMSTGFTGVFGFLAVVIRYLGVIVNLTFKKQKYLIADIEKISSE